MSQTLSRLLRAVVPALLLLTLPAWADTTAAPVGHAIGSVGFNEMLDKQAQPGVVFKTEEQADGSYLLSNSMQTVSAHITPAGVLFDSIGNSVGKGSFSLQLNQWGREGDLKAAQSSRIYSEDAVVYHTHAGGIAEKFSNSNDGIRQDFIIPVKPQGNGELQVQLHVSGAHVEQKNNGAVIVLQSGRKLTYNNLKVMDSKEQIIPAQMVVANNRITIKVDDSSAQYPLTIDPTVGDENWVSMGGIPGANGYIYALAVDGSGNVYAGGHFTMIGDMYANSIAKWNGSEWSALGSGIPTDMGGGYQMGPVSAVHALAVDEDGNLYVGGTFNMAGGVAANGIAKWNGSTWNALGVGGEIILLNGIWALAVDSSNNLYAGGNFYIQNNPYANAIAKWDGSAWSALGSGINLGGNVNAIAVDVNNNVYAGGNFVAAGGVNAANIAMWNGSNWSALGSGINGSVYDMVLDQSGSMYVGGTFTSAGGAGANSIAKWDGSAWSVLGSGMNGYVNALAINNSGVLFAGGNFTSAGGVNVSRLAKWDGGSWDALGGGVNEKVYAIAVLGGSNIVVGGYFNSAGTKSVKYIANWDGASWSAMGAGVTNIVDAIAVDGSGNVYVGGHFTEIGDVEASRIAKWDGTSWSALGTGLNGGVYALALDGIGNVYAAGSFTVAGGVGANRIAKWNGSAWLALGSGIDGAYVNEILLDDEGNLYAAGVFTVAGVVTANGIAKWNGEAWSALGSGMNSHVYALAFDSGGNLIAGGQFTVAGGNSANYIARWTGSEWLPLGSGMNGYVYALALDSNGNLYAGGWFTMAGGASARRVARWNGSVWDSLGSGLGDTISAFAIDHNGNVYAGGNVLAKWNGEEWRDMGSGFGDASVHVLAVDDTGELYVGGDFTWVGDKISPYFAKWMLDDDEDGISDISDAFPFDTDNDGLNNNVDLDDDGDGVPDYIDFDKLNAEYNFEKNFSVNGDYKGSLIRDGASVP